jgi:hypothetical protein
MAQVFTGDGKQIATFLPVNRGLCGLHVVGGASFDLDEAQDIVVPSNQVNLAATIGRSKIAGDYNVPVSSKIEIGIFFTTPSSPQMLWSIVRRKSSVCDPIKDANRGVSKTAGKHWIWCRRRPAGPIGGQHARQIFETRTLFAYRL